MGHGCYFYVYLIPIVLKQDLAFDLSLAALLGDNIYNFGELLAHPIVSIACPFVELSVACSCTTVLFPALN